MGSYDGRVSHKAEDVSIVHEGEDDEGHVGVATDDDPDQCEHVGMLEVLHHDPLTQEGADLSKAALMQGLDLPHAAPGHPGSASLHTHSQSDLWGKGGSVKEKIKKFGPESQL